MSFPGELQRLLPLEKAPQVAAGEREKGQTLLQLTQGATDLPTTTKRQFMISLFQLSFALPNCFEVILLSKFLILRLA